jgi:hypothetical protein
MRRLTAIHPYRGDQAQGEILREWIVRRQIGRENRDQQRGPHDHSPEQGGEVTKGR